VFALASVICLRGVAGGVCLCLRWHPRFAFVAWLVGFACVCAGIRVLPSWRGWWGLLVFALASAFCLRASRVAPVRGGTYFSLPPQRKVGKRKRLTPPARVPIHGPPTSPPFTRQCPGWCSLPTL